LAGSDCGCRRTRAHGCVMLRSISVDPWMCCHESEPTRQARRTQERWLHLARLVNCYWKCTRQVLNSNVRNYERPARTCRSVCVE
jgi:hypothetical protein